VDPNARLPVRIEWKGRVVAAFRRMSELERSPSGAAPSAGEIERLEPSSHPPVTFDRGSSDDAAFAKWAASSREPEDLVVRLFDDEGRPERAFRLSRCVVATLEAEPTGEGGLAIARLGVEHGGWERV
jgi:hypothetical protein